MIWLWWLLFDALLAVGAAICVVIGASLLLLACCAHAVKWLVYGTEEEYRR